VSGRRSGAVRAATGLRVGRELAITGFDRVADALIDRLVNKLGCGGPAEGELVPTDLVLGGST